MKIQTLSRYVVTSLVASLAVASASVTTIAHAQSSAASAVSVHTSVVTRAQLQSELAQLEAAGYDPRGDNSNYPEDLQAAEARVAAMTQPRISTAGNGV